MKPRRLHIWMPDWVGPGGIQAYSRNLVSACAELLPETEIIVLVRNGPLPAGVLPPRVSGHTSGRVSLRWRRLAYGLLLTLWAVMKRPELVIITHLHFAPLARLLHRVCGFRYWVVAHGIEAWSGLSSSRQRALKRAEKILPVSYYTAGRLSLALGRQTPPLLRLPNMVDETEFAPGPKPPHLLRRYGFQPDDIIWLTVARLDPRQRYKGCDQVLEALDLARRELPGLRYVIAGRGDDSTRLRRIVVEMGLQEHVVLTGFVPEDELPDLYRLCDFFVMPSQAEGFGIVFLEALACGRRVVAGNSDASAEPLLGGKLGELVDPQDSSALAATLLRLARDPVDPSRGEFLRRTVLDHFGTRAFRRRLGEALG
jgi:glycosyltransferase involved in cell wall biosynthesis